MHQENEDAHRAPWHSTQVARTLSRGPAARLRLALLAIGTTTVIGCIFGIASAETTNSAYADKSTVTASTLGALLDIGVKDASNVVVDAKATPIKLDMDVPDSFRPNRPANLSTTVTNKSSTIPVAVYITIFDPAATGNGLLQQLRYSVSVNGANIAMNQTLDQINTGPLALVNPSTGLASGASMSVTLTVSLPETIDQAFHGLKTGIGLKFDGAQVA